MKEILEHLYNVNKNVIVRGSLSSGKTTNVMFPIVDKMISNNENLLFVDSKEEYLNNYYNKLKEKGYNCIILNLDDVTKSVCWNPLAYPYDLYKSGNENYAISYLDKIGNTMFYEKNSVDPFWSNSAKDCFSGLTLGLFEDANLDEVNFNSLDNMVDLVSKEDNDIAVKYLNLKKDSAVYSGASATVLAPNATRGGIVSVIKMRLRLFTTNNKLSNLLAKSNINYDELKTSKNAIFIKLKSEKNYYNGIASIFIEQMYHILSDSKVNSRYNFILDNYDDLFHMSSLISMMSASISKNIKFYIGTRLLKSIFEEYSDYIITLSDVLTIKKDSVELKMDDVLKNYSKNFDDIKILDSDIEYPITQSNVIKKFDMESYINNK